MGPDAERALTRLATRIRRCTQCPLHEGRRLHGRRYLPTYHPAAAMRFPIARAGMRADLRKLERLLHGGA